MYSEPGSVVVGDCRGVEVGQLKGLASKTEKHETDIETFLARGPLVYL